MIARRHHDAVDETRAPEARPLPAPAAAATVLRMQQAAGNRAVTALLSREPDAAAAPAPPVDDAAVDALIARGDWHGAARTLAEQGAPRVRERATRLASPQRQSLVEGARHGTGLWDSESVVAAVDALNHRDAVIGSVRYFVWKREWPAAGTFLCGLDDPDMQALAASLRLTVEDLQAIGDEQPDPAQKARLYKALLGSDYFGRAPHDLVGRDAATLTRLWLLADPVVGPLAAARYGTGVKTEVTLLPPDQWQDWWVKRFTGTRDPDQGHTLTREQAAADAGRYAGVTLGAAIFIKAGADTPQLALHETVHALAADAWADAYGRPVDEGATEHFARRVARTARREVAANAYSAWADGVGALVPVIGEATLAQTFFEGRTLAFEAAVDAARGEGAFKRWLAAMNAGGGAGAARALDRAAGEGG